MTATGHRRPEGVDLTVDGTIRQSRREWRQAWRCHGRATAPAAGSPVRRLAHPRNPRNPRSLLCWVTRRASFLGSVRRSSAFRLRGRKCRPAEHAERRRTGRCPGCGSARTDSAPREAPSMSSLSPPWNRAASGLTVCGGSGMPPPPTPSASGGGWNFGDGGPGVAA